VWTLLRLLGVPFLRVLCESWAARPCAVTGSADSSRQCRQRIYVCQPAAAVAESGKICRSGPTRTRPRSSTLRCRHTGSPPLILEPGPAVCAESGTHARVRMRWIRSLVSSALCRGARRDPPGSFRGAFSPRWWGRRWGRLTPPAPRRAVRCRCPAVFGQLCADARSLCVGGHARGPPWRTLHPWRLRNSSRHPWCNSLPSASADVRRAAVRPPLVPRHPCNR